MPTETTNKIQGWFSHLTKFSDADYEWRNGRLVARGIPTQMDKAPNGKFSEFIVRHIYADHNASSFVRRSVAPLLSAFDQDAKRVGLNFGSGQMRFHERIINLDVQNTENVNIVSDGGAIPLKTSSVDLIITQEVLEHIADYNSAVNELKRIMRPGGTIYCQLPFQIGFHPGPYDFRRYTKQGIVDLFTGPHWEIEKVGISVGHGTALYRIAVEFCAVTASAIHRSLYKPVKGLSAIFLWPLKLFDRLTERSPERDRIAGGFFIIAKRTDEPACQ